MTLFPDESNHPKAQNQMDVIRPDCSVGINWLLGLLKQWAEVDKTPRFHLMLMNVFTMVRNIWFKGIQTNQIVKLFNDELDTLTIYLEAYLYQVANGYFELPLVLYYPHYEAIPPSFRRKPSPDYERFMEGYKLLLKGVAHHHTPKMIHKGYKIHRWIMPCSKTTLPRHQIARWVKNGVSSKLFANYTLGDPIFILTGIPVDLHLCFDLPNFQLWEYYTGMIKKPHEFYTKLNIPKGVEIPFNNFTHRVFGDKITVEGIVHNKQRTTLLQNIAPNKWMGYNDDMRMKDLKNVGVTQTYKELIQYKF